MAVAPELRHAEPADRRFLDLTTMIKATGMATDARKLILGLVGLALLVTGWRLIDGGFGMSYRDVGRLDPGATIRLFEPQSSGKWADAAWLVTEPARIVVGPFVALFSREVGPRLWFWAVAKGIWSLIVWGIIGGAIARIAVVQATVGGGVGVMSALRFAGGRALALVGAPLTPFLAVAVIAAGCAAFGLIYRIPAGIGASIASILGFIPLLAGVVMAFILIGLALGWPLMHATVAAEGEDVADALSRSYSYVNQRASRYLAHLGLGWALGVVGLVVVILFARAVLSLADWGVSLGAPRPPSTIPLALLFLDFWTELVGWVVHAYLYSYFWSAIALIYLILRQDVDGTDFHDVYLPDQVADAFAGSPASPALDGAAVESIAPPGAVASGQSEAGTSSSNVNGA